ncbi:MULTISPECIES: porin [Burkholderia]|jgi:predicted porin|nr:MULTISPECIES: porin [Burkholderia]MBN3775560.1 porin [Burkholderia sp. Se-20378]MBN3799793.1 porin [Burkholderia sp. Ac-20392]MBN3829605.1 porin [Burkholderia sp. Ac-20384]MBY8609735.1 porin [Burkholderia arboris]MCA3782081.1 porin [Burkholderia sp.]
MKKKLIASSVMLLACAGAHAQSRIWLSGYMDLNIEHLISSGPGGNITRMSSGGLNNSRFNLSGVEELGGGNKAVFTIEPMFSANTGVQSTQFRQSFVGLKGNWGELTMGRQFTPSYWLAGYADPTWAADFSMVNDMQFFYATYRVDNALQYKTPTFHGFTGRVMITTGLGDGTRAGRFFSTGIEYRNGPLFLGAVSELQYTRDIFRSSQIHSSRDNYFSAVYRFGGFEPTVIYHTYNGYYAYPPYVAFNSQGWDAQIGARWNIDGINRVYLSVVHRHDDNNTSISSATGGVIGYIYGLSKRTDLYVTAAHVKSQHRVPVAYPVTFQVYPDGGQNPSGFQIGIRHAF